MHKCTSVIIYIISFIWQSCNPVNSPPWAPTKTAPSQTIKVGTTQYFSGSLGVRKKSTFLIPLRSRVFFVIFVTLLPVVHVEKDCIKLFFAGSYSTSTSPRRVTTQCVDERSSNMQKRIYLYITSCSCRIYRLKIYSLVMPA